MNLELIRILFLFAKSFERWTFVQWAISTHSIFYVNLKRKHFYDTNCYKNYFKRYGLELVVLYRKITTKNAIEVLLLHWVAHSDQIIKSLARRMTFWIAPHLTSTRRMTLPSFSKQIVVMHKTTKKRMLRVSWSGSINFLQTRVIYFN